MKSHYDTLNISPNATKEEIKKSFHKLSLKYHPDLTKSKDTTNNEFFKQISSAYTVLSDVKQKQKYDLELNEWNTFGRHRIRHPQGSGGFNGNGNTTDIFGNQRTRGSNSGKFRFIEGITKPKNVVIGLTLGFVAVASVKSMLGMEPDVKHAQNREIVGDGKKKLVEAWMNPKTKQWEQPAPWSKSFQKLNPKIHMVQRENVRPSTR
jgi:DnaJ-class molecular chaperone